jgi:hypothetical protein
VGLHGKVLHEGTPTNTAGDALDMGIYREEGVSPDPVQVHSRQDHSLGRRYIVFLWLPRATREVAI